MVVEHGAERARREDVHVRQHRAGGLDPFGAGELGGELALGAVDVGEDEGRAGRRQAPGEPLADVAAADDGHGALAQLARAERDGAARPHGRLDSLRGIGAGVASAAVHGGQAHHVRGALCDRDHVARAGAHVLGGDVGALERVDGVGEVEEHGAAVVAIGRMRAGRQADHSLAAAQDEVGGRRLEGHRTRQAQGVARRLRPAGVVPHSAAAEGRPEHRGMHRNDGVEPGAGTAADDQLLVVERQQRAAGRRGRRGGRRGDGDGVGLGGHVNLPASPRRFAARPTGTARRARRRVPCGPRTCTGWPWGESPPRPPRVRRSPPPGA